MKSTSLSTPSTMPAPKTVQVEITAQLRSAVIALRDALFEHQEAETRLADIHHDLRAAVLKLEAALIPPDETA